MWYKKKKYFNLIPRRKVLFEKTNKQYLLELQKIISEFDNVEIFKILSFPKSVFVCNKTYMYIEIHENDIYLDPVIVDQLNGLSSGKLLYGSSSYYYIVLDFFNKEFYNGITNIKIHDTMNETKIKYFIRNKMQKEFIELIKNERHTFI